MASELTACWSKPSCGDVMAYEKLNRCHMTCRAYETTMVRRV